MIDLGIIERLIENTIPKRLTKYGVRQKRKGAFHNIVDQLLSDSDRYLCIANEKYTKPYPEVKLIEEYESHQIGAKLFVNTGFSISINVYFEFTNYGVLNPLHSKWGASQNDGIKNSKRTYNVMD